MQMYVFSDELGRCGGLAVGVSLLESRDMSASRASLSILDYNDDSCIFSGSDEHQQLDGIDVDNDDDTRARFKQTPAGNVCIAVFSTGSLFLLHDAL